MNFIISGSVVEALKKLYPSWELEERVESFYREKLKLCSLVFSAGIILACALLATSKSQIAEDGKIVRNGYGEGDKKLILTMESEGIKKDVCVNVSEKRYTDEELLKMSEGFEDELLRTILKDNESLDHINSDLNFVKRIEGYPFSVAYSVSKPLMLSREGRLNPEKVIDGSEACITANISYFDYREELSFFVCLYKPELSKEEAFSKKLDEIFLRQDEATINEDYYVLPTNVGGKQTVFYDKKNNTGLIMVSLSFITALLIFKVKDRELDKEINKREELLMLEYPRLINKFTLFYNCGMPVKKIWFKICADYEKTSGEKNYLYEEMILSRNQISDGKSEIEAYEEFAGRVNLKSYQAFINLIIQAIVMGKKEFSKSLEIECQDAFNERKNKAKRLFEEAGTKLLVPMFMMLFVVVIIIMFPAFKSFK